MNRMLCIDLDVLWLFQDSDQSSVVAFGASSCALERWSEFDLDEPFTAVSICTNSGDSQGDSPGI